MSGQGRRHERSSERKGGEPGLDADREQGAGTGLDGAIGADDESVIGRQWQDFADGGKHVRCDVRAASHVAHHVHAQGEVRGAGDDACNEPGDSHGELPPVSFTSLKTG
jgi:hypothetical protein